MNPFGRHRKASMSDSAVQKSAGTGLESGIAAALGRRSVVLVGMMGAGKSSVGRRLAARLMEAQYNSEQRIART